MAMHQLHRNVLAIPTTGITGSTAASNYPGIDMRGYDGIAFKAFVSGTPSTNGSSISIQQDSSSGFGTAVAITGTSATLSSSLTDGAIITEKYRPTQRWVRMVHTKTSTADILSAVEAQLYRAQESPVTQSSKMHAVSFA